MKPFLPLLLLVAVTGCTEVDTRHDFLKLVQHPKIPLAPQTENMSSTNGLAVSKISFVTYGTNRVPGILIKPDVQGRRPVVIALHGTGGSKSSVRGLCEKLAGKGFIAVAIDAPYHGERAPGGKNDYPQAIVRAWHGNGEHPFFYDTVWDVERLVDYLDSRDDVDPSRIGLIGISKGGIETYLAAAADKRIAVAVPCIGVQSFRWALLNNQWQGRIGTIQPAFDAAAKEAGVTQPDSIFVKNFYDRVVPGIYGKFDGPAMVSLIAPRPLLIINSDADNHTPLPGVIEATNAAHQVYHANNADDRLAVMIQPKTGHKVLPESEQAAVDWFVRWLKP